MKKSIDTILQSVDYPEVKLDIHQQALKKSLLEQYGKKRGGDKPFMKRNVFRFAALGIMSIALIGVITVTTLLPKTPEVQAQEIVSNAMNHIVKLSDEERKVLESKIKADLQGSLAEAQQAEDLTVVPEEEIKRVDPPKEVDNKDVFMFRKGSEDVQPIAPSGDMGNAVPGTKIAFSGDVMAPHGVKVLRYTDPQGRKVILGINEQNEPVMKMMMLRKEDLNNLPKTKEFHLRQDQ
jgi:hypothetical protein